MEARGQIESLINEFAWCVDHDAYDRVPDLFTEDGVFENPRGRLAGQKELREGLGARGKQKTATTRHVITNIHLEEEAPDRIRGWCTLTFYSHDGEGPGTPDPAAIAEYHDVYVRGGDDRWRILERVVKPVFVRQASG